MHSETTDGATEPTHAPVSLRSLAVKPKFDFRAVMAEAAKPKVDFRTLMAEATRPKFDFRALATEAAKQRARPHASIEEVTED